MEAGTPGCIRMQIYLDHSATTPPRAEAIAKMQAVLTRQWGNPASPHAWGERAATELELARWQVAALLNAEAPETIAFTSGGTEADNLALVGVARQYRQPQHAIISSVEHPAVTRAAELLERWGWQVTRLPVDGSGRVAPADLEAALQPNTVLVSVIYGQSEVGTLQPIAALGHIARQQGALFHTDAVQAAGRLPLDVQQLPVDLLSLSSHKLYGPQGAGALYVRPGVTLAPLLEGGAQESGLRSGTPPLPAIAGLGEAARLAAAECESEGPRLAALRDRLFERLAERPELSPTGHRQARLPHHASFCLRREVAPLSGQDLVRQLNLAGIAISAGSACSSGKLEPSPTLLAMGYAETAALQGIRLSLGRATVAADVDWTATVLGQALERARHRSSLVAAP